MTNEEAIKILKEPCKDCDCHWEYGSEKCKMHDCYTALEMAIEALQKQEKYRWHDLRKNSNDLPNGNKVEIIMKPNKYALGYWGEQERGVGYYYKKFNQWMWVEKVTWVGENEMVKEEHYSWLKVIAWREIEQFEDVEQ